MKTVGVLQLWKIYVICQMHQIHQLSCYFPYTRYHGVIYLIEIDHEHTEL